MKLRRVAVLYARVEEMRKGELQRASAAVLEVERAVEAEHVGSRVHAEARRAALAAGDRVGWASAAAWLGASEARCVGLGAMQAAREVTAAEAAEAHRESRVQHEQMERLVDGMRRAEALVAGRREQALADDRFAGRGAWRKGQMSEG